MMQKAGVNYMKNELADASVLNGTFFREVKNRFLCEICIEGTKTLCYVPSSCRLDNLIDLEGKDVLVTPTKSKHAKVSYSLFAVVHKKNYIILNSSMANKIIIQNISSRRFSFLGKRSSISKECIVDGYKCDIFIQDTNTLIEVKSIITTDTYAKFPSVYSIRAIEQLRAIKKHLSNGNPATYMIVSLSPYVRKIILDQSTPFYSIFKECVDLGMTYFGISSKIKDQRLAIYKSIEIQL